MKKYKYNKKEKVIYYGTTPILGVRKYIINEKEFTDKLITYLNGSPSLCSIFRPKI